MSDYYFSDSYAEARQRFLDLVREVGATSLSYPINCDGYDDLSIDVALLGEETDGTVLVSSGVHGVEGFFGSAIQLAQLEQIKRQGLPGSVRFVLIHSLNPFGFAQIRRFNEDNIDLNRNFVTGDGDYAGAPNGYDQLNDFLNPRSPPSRFEPYRLKALLLIWRLGIHSIKASVAGGQYEYPRGMFFGGRQPSQSADVVRAHCEQWIGASPRVMHIDLHTGLGRSGTYKLLLAESTESPSYPWYEACFGAKQIEPYAQPQGTAYKTTGGFSAWLQQHFSDRFFRGADAEFGTHPVVRVLGSIRAENRAFHYCDHASPRYEAARQELLECFCPKSLSWRQEVIDGGLKILAQAAQAIQREVASA